LAQWWRGNVVKSENVVKRHHCAKPLLRYSVWI